MCKLNETINAFSWQLAAVRGATQRTGSAVKAVPDLNPHQQERHALRSMPCWCRRTRVAAFSDLPFSDEVRQLLGGNLPVLHVVVQHIKAIVLFSLHFKHTRTYKIGQIKLWKKNKVEQTVPNQFTDQILPWTGILPSASSRSASTPAASAEPSGRSCSS